MSPRRFRLFAYAVLCVNLAVICWGAYVRSSGSGAGCGNHWPLCKQAAGSGEHHLIELLHRLTTGAAGVLVAVLVVIAFRSFARGAPVRKAATAAALTYVLEALIGAAIVKLGLVAYDPSIAHALAVAIHFVNTLVLLASLALVAWFAETPGPVQLRSRGTLSRLLAATIGAILLLAMTGAVAALADLIFPVDSFREGLQRDFSAGAATLLRLRMIHPVLAVVVSLLIVATYRVASRGAGGPHTPLLARWLGVCFLVQVALGLLNLGFAAPTILQMLHLLGADATWISLILLAASALVMPVDAPAAALTTSAASAGGVTPG
ncbi:MAG: COX15/CtaA family protein [Kofleriaceae bacterium]